MNALKMCLNWKVLAGLGVVALGIFAVAPDLVLGALPLLLLAACPLSMVVMMWGMRNMGGMPAGSGAAQGPPAALPGAAGAYTCPMHPQVSAAGPGACPVCGMALVPTTLPQPAAVPGEVVAAPTREERLAELRAQFQSVSEQQAALARQLEQLQGAAAPSAPSKALQEAEQVARAAEGRR
jgi:hypothetical protein